jgi:hypothetical protein
MHTISEGCHKIRLVESVGGIKQATLGASRQISLLLCRSTPRPPLEPKTNSGQLTAPTLKFGERGQTIK